MSLIKVKQIGGPSNNDSAFIAFDPTDNKVKWTTDIKGGVKIPAGTTAERPQAATEGTIRYNTDLEYIEVYSNGEWTRGSGVTVDPTQISDAAKTTNVDTDEVANTITFTANNKRILDIEADVLSTQGEKLVLKNSNEEVQFTSKNTTETGDVDIRFVPQNEGLVFFGITGDGVVESEDTFDTIARGGEGKGGDAGNIFVTGGSATEGNYNGGSVTIKGGSGFGTGENGSVSIKSPNDLGIIDFQSQAVEDPNWLVLKNGELDEEDELVNSISLAVHEDSSANDVNLIITPKGQGLVKVGNFVDYQTALNTVGNLNALVTKKYVSDELSSLGQGVTAGDGVSIEDQKFNILQSSTIGIDEVNNSVVVKSSNTLNQVLFSTGDGTEASWNDFDISEDYISGVLPVLKGGTNITTYNSGDILIGDGAGELVKLPKGSEGTFLQSGTTTVQYAFVNSLKNAAGASVVTTSGPNSPANILNVASSATNTAVELAAIGTDSNISLKLNTKGTGLVFMKNGYTTNIGTDRETVVTKGFVDDAINANNEPDIRRQAISSNWTSQMNIGSVVPTIAGREILVSKIKLQVNTAVAGNSVTESRIYANATALTTISETDIGTIGTYEVELPETLDISGRQLKIVFYDNTGTTEATPSVGNIVVTVYYLVV